MNTRTDASCAPQQLAKLLPPKRSDPEPEPAIVDAATYEEAELGDVRERAYAPGAGFFDKSFREQFGEDEDAWEDEDEDEDGEPECRPQ